MEFIVFIFHKRFILQQPLENLPDMDRVFLLCLRGDQDVVQIHKHRAVQEIVDQDLKNGGSVGPTEGHDEVLKGPEWCVEGRIPLVALSEPDQMVRAPLVRL